MNGKEAKIQFDCVSGIEYNRNDFTQYFMKYYVVEKNKYFQKEYEQEMKLSENIRDKAVIEKYLKYSVNRHRVKMYFKDGNAFDNMSFG